MADRVLVWDGNNRAGNNVRPVFILDADYTPIRTVLYSDNIVGNDRVEADIKKDGVSIFSNLPVIEEGDQLCLDDNEDYAITTLEQDSVITCELLGGPGVTVALELGLSSSDE
jgi:hypothetical protein